MALAETIYQKSLDLPEEKAIEVIDFIYFLINRSRSDATVKQTESLYQAFEEAGLIGCIETDEQPVTTHEEKVINHPPVSCLDLIQEDLDAMSQEKPSEINRHAGKITLTQDPLEFQKP